VIQAQRSRPFEAVAEAAGVAIDTAEVYDPSTGDQIIAPTSVGLTEPRPGTWRIVFTVDVLTPAGYPFRVRWTNLNGDTTEEDLTVVETNAATPSTAEVAALLHARTKDVAGAVLGDFTELTNPTGTQVVQLIAQAAADVALRVGTSVPADYEPQVRATVAKRAANLVELAYFPEQTGDDRTVYQSLRLTYEEAVEQLNVALQWNMLASRGDELQRISSTATGGTVELTFEGQETAATIDAAAATAAELEAALVALSNVAPGDVELTGGPLDLAPILVAFRRNLGGTRRQLLTVDNSGAVGGTVTVELVRAGSSRRGRGC
jgi:hypothetical protein